MGLSQNGNTTDSAVGCEVVQMDVQQRGCAFLDAGPHGGFHSFEAVKIAGIPQINNEVRSSENFAITMNEVIKCLIVLG